jgi:glycosyltransferase involved in cell wall biosynthesis
VQTLHNYRLICPAATLFREGRPCEKCVGKLPLPAIRHKCYRQSRTASATAVVSLGIHRALGTYANEIDAYIALTNFARDKFLEAGFDADRIRVKPNFLDPDPGAGRGNGQFALFVGRLTEEKGVRSLLRAWEDANNSIRLKICGDGPLMEEVKSASEKNPKVEYVGRRPLAEVLELMGQASALIFPSLWYEGFPRTIVESLACGTPVIASDLGSMKELIAPGRTGALFTPRDATHLARTVIELLANPDGLQHMRQEAREEFVAKYGPEQNHRMMLDIYQQALARRAGTADAQLAAAT